MFKNLFLCVFAGIFFISCNALKDPEELYNLSADAWYKQIIKDLQTKELEKADTHYLGMASEHVADPLLESVLIILAQTHMDEEDYQKANFYLDEYSKKFATSSNIDLIYYLKIKAKFSAFGVPNRNQALMLSSKEDIAKFLQDYPNTQFAPLVETMLTKFNLGVYYLDENIAKLYEKIGKEESSQLYNERLKESEFYHKNFFAPELPWYRKIFE